MRKIVLLLLVVSFSLICIGCESDQTTTQVATTTAPVYEFTQRLCAGTDIKVSLLINENVSCLHDYTLQTNQMRILESAEMVIISGAGLEDFMEDILHTANHITDASRGISFLCGDNEDSHSEHTHHHSTDPHIWLSPANAQLMSKNIYTSLIEKYPKYQNTFQKNLAALLDDLTALEHYGKEQLSILSVRELITFHNGFSYLANSFDLHILYSIEEESGSEASARELIEIANVIKKHNLNCIFTEESGSTSASQILSTETGSKVYSLDMAMGERDYFSAMYHNIDTLKEALK